MGSSIDLGHAWRSAALLGVVAVAIPAAAFAQQPQQTPTPAAQTLAPASQVAPAPKPPVFNRVNEVMPAWLRIRGEFRERVEGFDGAGFVEDRRDLYYLSRVRLNTTVTPTRLLSFQVQAQDARVSKKTVGAVGTPFKAPFDLRMAFADVGDAKTPVAIRVGRQELAFGEQRLVGHVSWLNAARTFDAAKVTFRTPAFSVDAFGASVVRILDGTFDKSGSGNRFAGAYATTTKLIPLGTVEPYVFWRRDLNLRTETATFGDLEQTTLGVRMAGRMPGRLDYGIEMALQRGSLGTDDVEAWAGHWQLRESLPGAAAVRLVGEYNYASGDADPTDGVRGTFDQLYPTPHDKYGLANQIGWKNIHHARAGVEFTPVKGFPVMANYHSWWLAETRDGIYTAVSAPLARVVAGSTSRHVGQEVDVQVTRVLMPQLQLAVGYAHIFTGAFLKQATPGASYSYPYVMATYVFLAER
ncbi:MAG: Alginate exp protein [Acidobacteria bacterium]|nr:Alginate exp protein [Acidobacteriota bacterium]